MNERRTPKTRTDTNIYMALSGSNDVLNLQIRICEALCAGNNVNSAAYRKPDNVSRGQV